MNNRPNFKRLTSREDNKLHKAHETTVVKNKVLFFTMICFIYVDVCTIQSKSNKKL